MFALLKHFLGLEGRDGSVMEGEGSEMVGAKQRREEILGRELQEYVLTRDEKKDSAC